MLGLGPPGLSVVESTRRRPTTGGAAAGDLVLRKCSTDAPGRLWLTYVTEYHCRAGEEARQLIDIADSITLE
jgi:hypothetical protein